MIDRTAVALLSMLVLWQTGAGHDCKDGRTITVEEGDQVSLTCTIPGAGYLEWGLTFRGSDGKVSTDQVGNCAVSGNGNTVCQVKDTADYELTSQGLLTATLTIKRSPSSIGEVLCTGMMLHSSEEHTHSCHIEVHYPADKVRNCSLQWEATDGSVFGSCDVDKISPEDGEYECLWRHESSTWKVQINNQHSEELGNHSVRCVFQGYVLSKANHTESFSLTILRRSTSSDRWLVAKRFPIEKPGEPEFANCPTAVTEGSNFTCLCRPSSSRPGTPRPVVTWLQRTPNNPLRLSDVKSGLDGLKYTCYQYWGGWNDGDVQTASYTMHVKYPPGHPSFPQNNSGFLPLPNRTASTIFCQVRDGNPGVQAASLHLACTGVHKSSREPFLTDKVWTIQLRFTPKLPRHNGSVCTCSVTTVTPAGVRTHKAAEMTVLVTEASVPQTTTISQTTSRGDKMATTPTTISRTTSRGDKVATTSTTFSKTTSKGGKVATTPTTFSKTTSKGGKVATTPTTISQATSRGGKVATIPATVSSSGGTKDPADVESDQGPPIVIIASATAGGLVIIIIVIVIVVVVLKQRGGARSTKDRSTKDKNADFEEYINDLYVSSDQCLSIHPHTHPPAAHLPDPTNQRAAAAAAVSPASRDGGNAVDRDQETSFRSSTVPLARSGPAASRDGPTTNQNAGAGPSHEDEIPSDQGREPKEKTSTANNEDEYNVLNFHRGAPKTSSIDTDAEYSHIDAVGKKP